MPGVVPTVLLEHPRLGVCPWLPRVPRQASWDPRSAARGAWPLPALAVQRAPGRHCGPAQVLCVRPPDPAAMAFGCDGRRPPDQRLARTRRIGQWQLPAHPPRSVQNRRPAPIFRPVAPRLGLGQHESHPPVLLRSCVPLRSKARWRWQCAHGVPVENCPRPPARTEHSSAPPPRFAASRAWKTPAREQAYASRRAHHRFGIVQPNP